MSRPPSTSWNGRLERGFELSSSTNNAAGSRSTTTRKPNSIACFNTLWEPTEWCRRQESNLRPTDYETVALTT